MALFRGGPRSNITQVVSPMYQGIIQAEKQKGQAVREAMGAFGKAIDPKTIGMRKFKEEFANADWTNPETYFTASKFLSEFDPTAAIDMSNRGMELKASMTPDPSKPEFVTASRFEDGVEVKGSMNKRTGEFTSFGGTGQPVNLKKPEYAFEEVVIDDAVYTVAINKTDPTDRYAVGTGKPLNQDSNIKPTTLAQKVTEAFGYDVGTPEHQEEMQKLLSQASTQVSITMGDGKQGLTPTQRSQLQKQVVQAEQSLSKLKGIEERLDDSYLTIYGKAKAKFGSILDQMGIDKDTPIFGGAVAHSAQARAFKNQVQQLFNAYRKEITGAAAAVAELDRLEQSFLTDKNMGPETFKTVLSDMKSIYADGINEIREILTTGVTTTPIGGTGSSFDIESATELQIDEEFDRVFGSGG